MTNPNNAIGTNAAFGGRTSANAFNDVLSAFSGRGIVSGWECAPSSGLTVVLGGSGNDRDVAIAEDNVGNSTTINNISASPVSVTIPAAPTANSRVDSIVAYVVKPPVGSSTQPDNPAACGLITVSGTVSASPSAPNESAIRTAITADGAAGNSAYYVVLANITIASGTTTLTSTNIEAGPSASLEKAIDELYDSAGTGKSVAITLGDVSKYRFIMVEATYNQYDSNYGNIIIPVSRLGQVFTISGANTHGSSDSTVDNWTIRCTTTSTSITLDRCTLCRVTNDATNVVGYVAQSILAGKVYGIY